MYPTDNPVLMKSTYNQHSFYNWKNKRFLIIEDDYVKYLLFQEMLSSAQVCLIRAISFNEAFEILARKPNFDLVIMNISMAGNDDCRKINHMKMLWPEIPLLAVTKNNECRKKNKPCFPVRCDMNISFNMDLHQLLETVNEMLNPVD